MLQLKKFTYGIHGMTCSSCVRTINDKISALPGVISAKADLEKENIEISAYRNIELNEVRLTLASSPKYSVTDEVPRERGANTSFLTTYKPLLIIFALIFLVSLATQVKVKFFDVHLLMNHVMAGFFIGFSLFKFLDLKAFTTSFANYDVVAKHWAPYGYVYPFIELALGLMFISGLWLRGANGVTVLILSLTTAGIYQKLGSKSTIQCACLGTSFNLPLSKVTIAENAVMIAMAIYGLI